MATNNNKTERDIYMEALVPFISTFMNELEDRNQHVVERTVKQLKEKFALDDAQEAALQITLFGIEMTHMGMRPDFPLPSYVGLMSNVICDILTKDYRTICDKVLTEDGIGVVSDDDEDDEYIEHLGMVLIKYFGTCMGKDMGETVTEADVMEEFNVYFEAEDDAKKVLAGFVEKMKELSTRPVTEEEAHGLILSTIAKLNEYNENMG